MRVFVEGIGLLGPGLNGWQASRPLLRGEAAYANIPTVVPASELLPPAERRRTSLSAKLALGVGHAAFVHAGRNAATTATVFTSSTSDTENLHHICTALASMEREVSPTRFHNSVHNAPAGYWSIATRSHALSSSLCCHDASFAAGLLDAAAFVAVDGKPVALITHDQPYPEPLQTVRPISASFGMALVMAPQTTDHVFATLDINFVPGNANVTRMMNSALDTLRATVPSARCLPLLAALAHAATAIVILAFGEKSHLHVVVTPC
jgi:hypothetical protein